MLTREVFTRLALGADLRADRVFPHPHHYTVQFDGMPSLELSLDDVIALLAQKRIEAPPAREIGDHYRYRVADVVWIRDRALDGYERGLGTCPVCGVSALALTSKSVAPRHGHTKEHPEPCAGSGKPLVWVVSREPLPVTQAAA